MVGQSPIGPSAVSFGWLLRQLRAEARMTQEELAQKAGLSPRSISDLERGISRTARKDTANLLADALTIGESFRAAFVAAARGRAPISDVLGLREHTLDCAPPGSMPGPAGDEASLSPREIELFEPLMDAMMALLRALAAYSRRSG